MALTFGKPTQGTGMPTRTAGRAPVANPFLDEGWLLESYEQEQDRFAVNGDGTTAFEGGIETYTIKKGQNAGQEAKRYTGDVKLVVNLIRAAAEKLGIGVSVYVAPAKGGNGRELKGKCTIQFLGKNRKNYNTQSESETSE